MSGHSPALVALKWAAALSALCLALLLGRVLRGRPSLLAAATSLLGLLPFVGLRQLSLHVVSYEAYRGDARGLEVTAIDFLACALLVALPRPSAPMPYRRAFAFFGLAAVLSIPGSALPLYSLFSVWKLARVALVVAAVARLCEDEAAAPRLLRGMAAGVLCEALLTGVQHFALHQYQARGTFEHQNTLTMACNLVAPIGLALLLVRPGRWAAAALIGGTLVCLFALSRGSLVSLCVSLVAVFAFSALRGLTRRKLAIAGVAAAAALVVSVKALPTIVHRFQTAPRSSADSRALLERAAALMVADHPLGVGVNQFSNALENQGYAGRAGIDVSTYDASAIVHNIYRLNAAELGLPGLLAFLILIGGPLALAISGTLRAGDTARGAVLLGCAAAFSTSYLQGTLEWLSRQSAFAYLYFMLAALVAALHRHALAAPQAAGSTSVRAVFAGAARQLASLAAPAGKGA